MNAEEARHTYTHIDTFTSIQTKKLTFFIIYMYDICCMLYAIPKEIPMKKGKMIEEADKTERKMNEINGCPM